MEKVALILSRRGYTMGISLGQGSYAKVWSAYSKQLKMNVAVKIINQHNAPKPFLERFLPRELDILSSLNHQNVVRTFEIFRTSDRVFIVMELGAQGDLLDLIKLRGALPEKFAKKLFCQLTLAMEYLHDQDIGHRDLKCENLLLDKNFNLKVSDFDFSKRLKYQYGRMVLSMTFCGSLAYAAPEVLQAIPYNPKVSDVWSMGVVLYIMLWGSMPFDDSNIKTMVRAQNAHQIDIPQTTTVPSECRDLIYNLLHPNTVLRFTVQQILQHSWIQSRSEAAEGGRGQHHTPSTSRVCTQETDGEDRKETSSDSAGASEPAEPNPPGDADAGAGGQGGRVC
ncbi:testis-specific serine/threonine-protein kinase 1-like [Trichomycterus rosablanca]|uniref:testis-specific serine/threonine-protein kinase 1-like n=1 Tax=Trichomycterus rosablanca TaxID=2290929 RepID=UPI002F35B570